MADDFQDEFSSEATKESSQAPPSHELTPLMEETGNHEAAGDQEQAVENASETEERATSEEAGSQSSEPGKESLLPSIHFAKLQFNPFTPISSKYNLWKRNSMSDVVRNW